MRTIIKFFSFALIFFAFISVKAQDNTDFSAILLNLNGKGTVLRANNSIELDVPQRFVPGDKIIIKEGAALVMLFSGEEVSVNVGNTYIIPEGVVPALSQINNITESSSSKNGLLAQAGAAYSIRGIRNVFPVKSKILDPENSLLYFKYGNSGTFNLGIKITDNITQEVIFEDNNIKDSIFTLSMVPFEKGKTYYYTIANTPDGIPSTGLLVYPDDMEFEKLMKFNELETNLEYINAITYYYSNNYFFEAYSLIKKAEEKFPDLNIYNVLMKNLMME